MQAATSDTTVTASLTELFSSVQGEGPYVGVRQIFVRFYGCHRRCVFCDSPETVTAWQPAGFRPPDFRIEQTPGRQDFQRAQNPLTVPALATLVRETDKKYGPHHSVAFTGGEPLLHAAFLREALPHIKEAGLKTYLETAGDLYHELDLLFPWLDIAAMDIKLPSVTLNEPAWGSHRHFLKRCVDNKVEVFCKAVVSADTDAAELEQAFRLVAEIAPSTLFVIQPLSPFGIALNPPRASQLLDWEMLGLGVLPNVRIIPQCHKAMGQL